ncbi:MAG: hypothetical protein JJT96_11815 [Opitutales bacterium]|nr:hypothetical protein [Opitutales bacterium]
MKFRDGVERSAVALRERMEALLPSAKAAEKEAWISWLLDFEDLRARLSHLASYLSCLNAAEANNTTAAKEEAHLQEIAASAEVCAEALIQGLGQLDEAAFDAILAEERLKGAAFILRELRERAFRRMDLARESLAAGLSVHGLKAWSRLYARLSSQITFTVTDRSGDTRSVPMAQRSHWLSLPERAVRKSAFENSNAAWTAQETVCEAALNAVAGTRHLLNQRRGVEHFLDNACVDARISCGTLEAMFAAIAEEGPRLRDAARFRFALMGMEAGAYYDLSAPAAPASGLALGWSDGCALVSQSFHDSYPALGEFFDDLCRDRWIDHSPRPHKRPGGFCSTSLLSRESRIFMTYEEDLGAVLTLAHEVGHAWHGRLLGDMRPFAAGYPMTLAESASTFAEMILIKGILDNRELPPAVHRELADLDLRRSIIFLLELPARFHFEKRFHEERAKGYVPANRLREIMVEAEQACFGDALAEDGVAPLFWASKQHFYLSGVHFYNFPYTFGFLLSRALFDRFEAEGPAYLNTFERFLRESGSRHGDDLLRDYIGGEPADPSFWVEPIRGISSIVERMRSNASSREVTQPSS